jgi:hypothetical protein
MLQASDDGVHWETQRSVNMQASSSVNLNWVDSGKKYFFKIISNNITCSTYSIVVDSFDLDIIFTVVSIETTRVALIDIENWNPFFDIYLPKDVNAIGSIIPVMTSATAPSGTVSFPQEQPISIYWETIGSYIVPTTNAIAWQRAAGSSTYYTVSIDYTFDSPVSLAEAKLYFKNINPFIYPDQGGFIYPSFYAYVSKFNAVLTDYSVVNINPKWGPAFNDRDTFEIISDSPVINNVVTISFSLTQVFNESQASGSQQIRLLGMIASGISQTQTIINFSSHSYIWGTRPSGGYAFSSVCGGITQNRYIYANYPEDNFDRIIFSAIDSFYDLDAFSVDDQSAFTLRLPALKAQKILELIPFNSGVLALTTEGEYLIYGQDGVITPASCAVLKLSENGNQSITPCNMGNAFIGVGKDNSLYYQKFTQEGQAYPRFTISDLAKHFFTGKTVKEIVFCRNPENNLYVLFTDGKMVKLFFREADNAIAWSRFEIDAFITSIASIEDDGKDRLCILTADGNILISDIYEDERAAYLDFYRKFTGSEGVGAQTANTPSEPQALTPLFIKGEFTAAAATAANPFTEGEFNSFIVPDFDTANKPVYAVCYDDNGCWIERVKEAPGEIHKLDAPAKLIYCGLFYDSGIETLDFGGYDDNFTAKKGKIDRVQPYFIETAGIEINGEKLKNDDLNNEYIHFLNGKYGGENGIPTFKGSAMEKTLKIKSFAPLPWTLTRLNLGVGGVDEQG